MKNRIIKFTLLVSIITFAFSCTNAPEYKYQDKKQHINCPNEDNKLLNEALHSFEHDIASYYQATIPDIKFLDIELAYAHFVFLGAKGEIDLSKIVSKHSIYILSLLSEKGYLNNPKPNATNLNYHSDLVTCLVDQFKNKEIKTSIKSQIENNFLDPKLMAESYRINIRDASLDKNFALFLAFETYYQYLSDMDFSNMKQNE